jgi:hypothetical protein
VRSEVNMLTAPGKAWVTGRIQQELVRILYFLSRAAGWGGTPVQTTVADYGTKFIVVAGLLNIIAAVDAHNLRTGRKS